ncbi:sensor histidine kinase [Paenibacillus hexagrammi]|uniref:histidine kinase n=1 Tax=Paenibacillus hexagrammi TaxID=2908839 RepID=A0ABY3SK67_9BACL|nr:ATP-binding protein [Paenibacillus sp. YPD9-1]UJF34361.1 ATP-binding protein [Paenibacillus sp. YPD9-1]
MIEIRVTLENKMLHLTIKDNGTGMSVQQVEALKAKISSSPPPDSGQEDLGGGFSGIGLRNVFERMKLTFGDGFRLDVISNPGDGTCIVMKIPYREEAEDV